MRWEMSEEVEKTDIESKFDELKEDIYKINLFLERAIFKDNTFGVFMANKEAKTKLSLKSLDDRLKLVERLSLCSFIMSAAVFIKGFI